MVTLQRWNDPQFSLGCCCGLDCVPLKHVEVLALGPVSVTFFGTGLLADVIGYGEVVLGKVEPLSSDWCPYRKQGRNTDTRGGELTSGQRWKPISLSRATCALCGQQSATEGRSTQRKHTYSLTAGPKLRCQQVGSF